MIELTEALLAKMAGWEAMKTARGLVSAGRVVQSSWKDSELRGVVQQGAGTIKSGLIIRSGSDVDNLCACRDSRDRGLICAHSVAVGVHFLNPPAAAPKPVEAKTGILQKQATPQKIVPQLKYSTEPGFGEPLFIQLILPPNLADCAIRGKIMVYCEGQWSRGLTPANVIPKDVNFSVSATDARIIEFLSSLNNGSLPAMVQLDSMQFSELLGLCVDHPAIRQGRSQKLEVSGSGLPIEIIARIQPLGGCVLRLKNSQSGALFKGSTQWLFSANTFKPLPIPSGLESLLHSPYVVTRKGMPQFFNSIWPALIADCEVDADFSQDDFVFSPALPAFKLHLAGGLAILEADLKCFYGGLKTVSLGLGMDQELWLEGSDSPFHYQTRDIAAEQAALNQLKQGGFVGPDAKGRFQLKGQELVLKFFARVFPKMEKQWEVELEARLEQSTQNNLQRITPQFNVTPSGEEWFDLSVAYATPTGERFSQQDIQTLIRSGQSHKRLASGKFALLDTESLDEFNEILVDCQPEQRGGQFHIRQSQADFLASTLNKIPEVKFTAPVAWMQHTATLRGEVKMELPELGHLEKVLRDYQKQGVGWLAFLRENRFGGILADEMGLGKTLQVLSLLHSIKSRGELKGPCLVICPTSLVTNWAAEADRFTPSLRVLVLHGDEREKSFVQMPKADLVITSYALIRRDADHYRGVQFDTLILDEAQHIKNRQSQNAQMVKSIRASNRIVLTGTPMENSVLDLWSIFDFLMPGYLGTASDFRDRYEQPLSKEKNPAVMDRLSRRIKPFLLRRLKRDVARELPDKIEQISYCDLTPEQRTVYTQVLEASWKQILADAGRQGGGKSRMLMLTALLRLRQICCDLRLLEKKAEGSNAEQGLKGEETLPEQSAKMELFQELVDELIDGGHRTLVFSQFTSMLELLAKRLKSQSIRYCQLDGSTKDRAAVVAGFQNSPDIPVFLISLKAGGTGLNLTSADTVIHFDPWWNPAVEAQATDRAHRIGQTRVVTSYKLIARGTVEEKILNLQQRKRSMTQQIMGSEDAFIASMDWEELRGLLME